MRPAHLRVTARRLAWVRAGLLLVFLALAGRAAHLSVVDERGAILGERQRRTTLSLAPERGTILDRHGHELALAVGAPSVTVWTPALGDPAAAARALAGVLGRPAAELRERLEGRRSFAFVERWVTQDEARRVRELALPGIGVVEEPRRTYPHGALSAQVVGFANIDGRGVRGVEQQEESWLRGVSRRIPVERDGTGQLLVDASPAELRTAGGDVALTLDVAMQSDALLALAEAVEKTGARGGVAVSIDPTSGDVLALAELPGFDPNRFRELSYAKTRSRAFLDALEPGSTLKAFLVAAALENGALRPDDTIDCGDGTLRIPGKMIRDRRPFGVLRSAEVLSVSSNVGAVKIAFAVGSTAHVGMLRRFGFGSPTGSGFPDESAGLLRRARGARPVDQATLAFGQGVSVTAVQLASATAALANDGVLLRPRLVGARRAPGSDWQVLAPERVRRVVSPETATSLLAMLETVTEPGGTGRQAALHGVRVAGKTGTAQKLDRQTGRYSQDRFVSWFLGVVPADAPRLAIVVALDEPRRPFHTGGAAAAPLFAKVAAAQLGRLGILTEPGPPEPPKTRFAAAAPEPEPAAPEPVAAPPPRPAAEVLRLGGRVLLPDLRGLTVAEVKAVTAEAQLHVEVFGSGRAVAQEPPPGTVLGARERLEVRFEKEVDPS